MATPMEVDRAAVQHAASEIEAAAQSWRQGFWKLVWVLLAGAFLFGGWVSNIQINQISNSKRVAENTATLKTQAARHEEAMAQLSSVLHNFQVWKAGTEASRYTVQDHARHMAETNAATASMFETVVKQNQLQELRLQRLEDTQAAIMKLLGEIKQELKD